MDKALPFKISVLVFVEKEDKSLLLMKRNKQPNQGFYSPIGGKLEMAIGESPHQCAKREIFEEIALDVDISSLHLFAMVSEKAYEQDTHWLMFLFTSKVKIDSLPEDIDEGSFSFFSRSDIENLKIPETDRKILWKLYDEYKEGFASVYIDCSNPENMDIEIYDARR
ncbi:MAG: NUDIX domain-containing protein [Opitutales bacterium]